MEDGFVFYNWPTDQAPAGPTEQWHRINVSIPAHHMEKLRGVDFAPGGLQRFYQEAIISAINKKRVEGGVQWKF